MADRLSKTPKREGTNLSSVKRSDNRANKSRSPIITRSRSRGIDDIDSPDSSAITNHRIKRSSTIEEKQPEVKKTKVSSETNSKKVLHTTKSKSGLKHKTDTVIACNPVETSSSSSQGAHSFKIKKDSDNKKTGSSIGTRRKADLEASKSISSIGKHLKKSTSFEEFKNKFSYGSVPKSSPDQMDQNASNIPSNTNTSNNSNDNNSLSGEVSNSIPTSSNMSSYGVNDIDAEDSDMSRLQTILESRGLPRDLLGGIPRMQNFFYRSLNNTSNSKAQQLLLALNSTSNESEKLHYVLEMCQLLLMGNEDTLVGFPIKSVVPTLINLLSMEHNFEIMHHACRALTYMMEALPRSSIVVLDAIPVFLEKLQVIQCMDVAEQSLSALEMLSRRHNKSILHAHGVSACLTYLDFFSIDAQRSALTITANCFQNLTADDFQYVKDSLPILSSHLSIEDKKCIESICLAFSRLVDCYQLDCAIVSEIASSELLTNIQSVLMTTPPILSTGSFVNVIRMLSTMCSSCSQIAVELLKLNICETLKCLLLCNNQNLENSDSINLISRSPQEIYELTSFISELMPNLPPDYKIFEVDQLFSKTNQSSSDSALWQYKDDRGLWLPFSFQENKAIEDAHHAERDEIEIESMDRVIIIDLNSMQKIYEDTGTTYAIQRKVNPHSNSEFSRSNIQNVDPRSEFIFKEQELSSSFLKFIFTVLNEVYNNSAGFSVRYKCLDAILRILFHTPKELLHSILKDQTMSSSIATMLSSSDIRIVVCAIQMCNILMDKMPEIFSVYFQREGVMHQIKKLSKGESQANLVEKSIDESFHPRTSHATIYSHPQLFSSNRLFLNNSLGDYFTQVGYNVSSSGIPNIAKFSTSRQGSGLEKVSRGDENLKRKRTKKSSSTISRANSINIGDERDSANIPDSSYVASMFLSSDHQQMIISSPSSAIAAINEQSQITNQTIKNNSKIALGTTINQFVRATKEKITGEKNSNNSSNLTPPTSHPTVPTTSSIKDVSASQKASSIEKIKTWIKEEAKAFDGKYFEINKWKENDSDSSSDIMKTLTDSIKSLKEDGDKTIALLSIKKILLDNDLSSFELMQSELVKHLLLFLVGSNQTEENRNDNIRTFLNIFYGAPLSGTIEHLDTLNLDSKPLSVLINKLNACVSQLEQFPLSIHDFANNPRSLPFKIASATYLKIGFEPHPSWTISKKLSENTLQFNSSSLVHHCINELLKRMKLPNMEHGELDELGIDNNNSSRSSSHQNGRHRLQLMYKDKNGSFHALPYSLPLYQCFPPYNRDIAINNLKNQPMLEKHKLLSLPDYILYYRWGSDENLTALNYTNVTSTVPAPAPPNSSSISKSSRRVKSSSSNAAYSTSKSSSKKKDEIWLDGKTPKPISPLEAYLKSNLSLRDTINDKSVDILCLLRVLYGIVRYWGCLYELNHSYNPAIPLKEFINFKLTVKANRQLQDPFVIMGDLLPTWLKAIAYACPFMFPFDTRYLLFYVVSFDRERALQRLIENAPDFSIDSRERSIVPRFDKRKRVVSRNDIYKSAESLFNDLGVSKSLIEIQYENEVGTGLGPTLEFYALVSKEFQRADFDMWRSDNNSNCGFKEEKDASNTVNYVFSNSGLFPSPIGRSTKLSIVNKQKSRFKLLGKFMAKALMDSRMVDIPLNILFYKWLLNENPTLTIADVYQLDPTFSASILQMDNILQKKIKLNLSSNDNSLKLHGCSIDDLNLDFTLPGYSYIELRKGGRDMSVTIDNLENYINLVCNWSLNEGVVKQMEAFKDGFNSVFDLTSLKLFYPEELQQLFCGASYKSWDIKMLMDSCKTDHGFTHESRAIRFLFEILSSYDAEKQRKFLQFLTGSPRLPIGGFKSLIPPFTIVRKNMTDNEIPNCLPSVMTCVNYLKLPDYPSIEIMREKLDIAINEGQFSFHLS